MRDRDALVHRYVRSTVEGELIRERGFALGERMPSTRCRPDCDCERCRRAAAHPAPPNNDDDDNNRAA